MAFSKDKLHEELKKQVEALVPAMRKLNFEGGSAGPYWDEFFHRRARVSVKIVPFKEPNSYNYYGGFKLKINRSEHPGRGSNTVLVKIDNLAAVKTAITESISYIRGRKKSERANASFKDTLEKTLPRLFPGRETHVSEGRGDFRASINRKDHKGAWFDITLSRDGTVSKVEISYPGKELPDVAKFLETL